jgi:hypothetical protein
MMSEELIQLIVKTTVNTLRQVAWVQNMDYGSVSLSEMADDVEQATIDSLSEICPLCEEVVCDGGCPLEPVRKELS